MIHWPIGYTWPIGFSLPPRSIHWEPGRIESREPGAYPLGNGARLQVCFGVAGARGGGRAGGSDGPAT